MLGDVQAKSNTHKDKNGYVRVKPYKLTDGRGLYLWVTKTGKHWRYDYAFAGKRATYTYGAYPELSITEARVRHTEIRRLIADGVNPMLEKAKRKADIKLDVNTTFEVIVNQWLKEKARHVTPKYHKKISGMVNNNLVSRLGKLPISSINSSMLMETLLVIQARGAVDLMGRVRAHAAEIFNYAKSIGRYGNENPATSLVGNVAFEKHTPTNYKTFKANEDNDFSDAGEFLRRLSQYEGSLETKYLIQLQMLVATRPSEMRTAKWEEFNFDKALWQIPFHRMKMRDDHVIPLPKQALSSLMELKKITGYSSFLFPSNRAKEGVLSDNTANQAIKKIWTEYTIHPHGFRHLFSTICNDHAAADDFIIEGQLSHGGKQKRKLDIIRAATAVKDSDEIRSIYNSAGYLSERRKLNQWYADHLDQLRDGAKIIEMRKA